MTRSDRLLGGVAIALIVIWAGACRGLGREINQALPEFMRSDPGKEEMEIFANIRKSREYTPEDEANQTSILGEVQTAMDEARFGDASDALDDFLERYPSSKHDEDARFLLGLSRYRDESLVPAFRAFEEFSTLYPVSVRRRQVMEIEYAMGKEYLDGEHASVFGIFSQRGRGIEMLNHVVEAHPTGERAPDAQWLLARYYMTDEDWPKAEGAFSFLAEHYPTSEWYLPSLYFKAYCKYRQVKGVVYDPVTMRVARQWFEDYVRKAPEGPWVGEAKSIMSQLEEMEAKHYLEIAEWYLGEGKAYTARYYLLMVMARFPQTTSATRAKELLPPDTTPEPPVEPAREPAPPSPSSPATNPPPAKGSGV